jgi:hypothetical protein
LSGCGRPPRTAGTPYLGPGTLEANGLFNTHDVSSAVTVQEVDGTPSVAATTIKVPNGTLTDEGGGTVRIGGGPRSVGSFG